MFKNRTISRGMLSALILSIIIALMISYIPNLQIVNFRRELPVFKTQTIEVSEYNIVEFVSTLPIQLPVKKVDFSQRKLAIDFMVEKNETSQIQNVYKDLYLVIKKSLVQSNNIDQVVLRVFIGNKNTLYVSVIAQRKDILENPTMKVDKNYDYKFFLENYFGLNYSNVIKLK